jgi:nitrogen fixation-related uncharacterized protein
MCIDSTTLNPTIIVQRQIAAVDWSFSNTPSPSKYIKNHTACWLTYPKGRWINGICQKKFQSKRGHQTWTSKVGIKRGQQTWTKVARKRCSFDLAINLRDFLILQYMYVCMYLYMYVYDVPCWWILATFVMACLGLIPFFWKVKNHQFSKLAWHLLFEDTDKAHTRAVFLLFY